MRIIVEFEINGQSFEAFSFLKEGEIYVNATILTLQHFPKNNEDKSREEELLRRGIEMGAMMEEKDLKFFLENSGSLPEDLRLRELIFPKSQRFYVNKFGEKVCELGYLHFRRGYLPGSPSCWDQGAHPWSIKWGETRILSYKFGPLCQIGVHPEQLFLRRKTR